MNVLVSWIRDGKPVTAILDFIELAKSHSGQNMAESLVETLNRYGIAHKVGFSHAHAKKKNLPAQRPVLLQLITQLITIH
jgi:hypothetical protein